MKYHDQDDSYKGICQNSSNYILRNGCIFLHIYSISINLTKIDPKMLAPIAHRLKLNRSGKEERGLV